jgi:hypothetical protein
VIPTDKILADLVAAFAPSSSDSNLKPGLRAVGLAYLREWRERLSLDVDDAQRAQRVAAAAASGIATAATTAAPTVVRDYHLIPLALLQAVLLATKLSASSPGESQSSANCAGVLKAYLSKSRHHVGDIIVAPNAAPDSKPVDLCATQFAAMFGPTWLARHGATIVCRMEPPIAWQPLEERRQLHRRMQVIRDAEETVVYNSMLTRAAQSVSMTASVATTGAGASSSGAGGFTDRFGFKNHTQQQQNIGAADVARAAQIRTAAKAAQAGVLALEGDALLGVALASSRRTLAEAGGGEETTEGGVTSAAASDASRRLASISAQNFLPSGAAAGAVSAKSGGGGFSFRQVTSDLGLGADIRLMSVAGAIIGYYMFYVRGFSRNECAIAAAVGALLMLVVDAGLLWVKAAKDDVARVSKERELVERVMLKEISADARAAAAAAATRPAGAADDDVASILLHSGPSNNAPSCLATSTTSVAAASDAASSGKVPTVVAGQTKSTKSTLKKRK